MKKGVDLSYILQDALGSTSASVNTSGAVTSMIKYFPFGSTWSTTGISPTDKLFTGQRSDNTGLYYYGARYYDPEKGRFISADTIVPNPANPQSLNRYSYCLNNPSNSLAPPQNGVGVLKYVNNIQREIPAEDKETPGFFKVSPCFGRGKGAQDDIFEIENQEIIFP